MSEDETKYDLYEVLEKPTLHIYILNFGVEIELIILINIGTMVYEELLVIILL